MYVVGAMAYWGEGTVKKYQLGIFVAAAVMLTSCSEQASCSGDTVQDLVKEIEKKDLIANKDQMPLFDVDKITMTLSGIRTISAQGKSASCKAELKMHLVLSKFGAESKIVDTYKAAGALPNIDENGDLSQDISYDVRLTDDSKMVYVTINDNGED